MTGQEPVCSNREEKGGDWGDDTLAWLFDFLWPLCLQEVQRGPVHCYFFQHSEEP